VLTCNFKDEYEGDQNLKYVLDLWTSVVTKLPKDGTLVPKHVGASTYDALCFMIRVLFILLYAFVG
jgi:hypothetical protein